MGAVLMQHMQLKLHQTQQPVGASTQRGTHSHK